MLQDKIKSLRKQSGMTQEELAIKLKVVRQTISKWEKGLSVPDSQMIIKIAEQFEISVSELLGADAQTTSENNHIAEQLAGINEQLAIKNRRSRTIWKVVIGIFIGIIVFNILMLTLGIVSFKSFDNSARESIEVHNFTELYLEYHELIDGTFQCGDHNYKYRLTVTGRTENAVNDTTYTILSNIEDISFDQAWKASGLSSNTEDYFDEKDAIIVMIE